MSNTKSTKVTVRIPWYLYIPVVAVMGTFVILFGATILAAIFGVLFVGAAIATVASLVLKGVRMLTKPRRFKAR